MRSVARRGTTTYIGSGQPYRCLLDRAERGRIKGFVEGVTAGAVGAIAGAVVVLSRKSLVDVPTIAIALASLALLVTVKKLPEPVLIVAAGVVGFLVKRGAA